MTTAIYPFSADPITLGHIDIISRASKIFDRLIVGIGLNPEKKQLFSVEEKINLTKKTLQKFSNIEVMPYKGLVTDFAYENNISVLIRGVRNNEDASYELSLFQICKSLDKELETFFLPANPDCIHISSGAAKAIQLEQGITYEYVPIQVKQALEEKISGQYIIGVTGEMGCGKTFICEQLVVEGKKKNIQVHHINIDKLAHEILDNTSTPIYLQLRRNIVNLIGSSIFENSNIINRTQLASLLFSDLNKLKAFNQLIKKPLFLKVRQEIYNKRGLILLDSALLAESALGMFCNNHIILVSAKKNIQSQRLIRRGYSENDIQKRLACQFTNDQKKTFFETEIKNAQHGKLWEIKNDEVPNPSTNPLMQILFDYFKFKENKL